MQQMQIQGTEIQIKEYPVLHQGTSIRTVTGSLKILIFSG